MNQSISEPDIVSALRQRLPSLLAIYLFGSRATGHAGTDSDLDLAVLVEGKLEPLAACWKTLNVRGVYMADDVVHVAPELSDVSHRCAGDDLPSRYWSAHRCTDRRG